MSSFLRRFTESKKDKFLRKQIEEKLRDVIEEDKTYLDNFRELREYSSESKIVSKLIDEIMKIYKENDYDVDINEDLIKDMLTSIHNMYLFAEKSETRGGKKRKSRKQKKSKRKSRKARKSRKSRR
jgi:5'-deoxynucleotidase YfbR-like HD superfamily hydrolase